MMVSNMNFVYIDLLLNMFFIENTTFPTNVFKSVHRFTVLDYRSHKT